MNKRLRHHLFVIGFYTLLALLLTWPLVAYLTSHIPGEATWAFDESTFIWNMWWFKFSLLKLEQTPLVSTYTFFPLGVNLTTYTFNLFNAAFGLPLQLAFSLPLAQNLALLFSYVASAYGMFLLCLYLLHQPDAASPTPPARPVAPISYLAAFAAGAGYAFSASRMMYVALGHYNFVTIQWFPFYTLFLLKTLRGSALKTIMLTALFAAFCLYAELTYSVFLIFITLLVFVGEWVNRRKGQADFSFIRGLYSLVLVALFTLIFAAPFVFAVLPDFLDPAYAEPGWGEGLKLSADLVGLFTLTPLHPLAGVDWVSELRAVIEGTSRFNDANTLFLGYGILALALLGFLARRKAGRIWFWGVIVFTLLSLGPLLTINGQNRFDLDGLEVTFPMPFALLHYIPVINAHRVPNRFGIPLSLCLAVLVGYGVNWLLLKLNKYAERKTQHVIRHNAIPTFAALLLLALIFDQYSVPLPLTDARIPEVYHQIGAEPDDFTLIQLPLGWRNSYGTLGAERTQLQYYQAAHHRPMLGGNTSRNPAFKFDYYANIPLFTALTQTELYRSVDETTLAKARSQATDLMTLYNIKYLVIHAPIEHRKPYEDTYLATRRLALDLIPHEPSPIYQSPGVEAFAVAQAPIPNPFTIDFGDWTGDPYRGEGWDKNEEIFAATANWATGTEALIYFPVRSPGNRYLSIQIAPFNYPGMPEQTVAFSLNGQLLADTFLLREGWQVIKTILPEAYVQNGLNRLTLHFAHTAQPREVLPASRMIGNTGLETPVDVEVNSSADFAFITVGFGKNAVDASAHRRGVNMAVINPQSGEVLEVKGFDTAANEFEAAALNQFIANIPEGYIVIVATQGPEATAFFDAETRAGLESLGLSAKELTPPLSAIGVKGAFPGTALQKTGSNGTSAYLRLGAAPDDRTLAAAVDKVTIRQEPSPE
ncbi:MAG: hypothetical protein JXM69_02595 [Anaerolineae bacterium]|nr:hypothetical protein [Anaerolineae bacterium]